MQSNDIIPPDIPILYEGAETDSCAVSVLGLKMQKHQKNTGWAFHMEIWFMIQPLVFMGWCFGAACVKIEHKIPCTRKTDNQNNACQHTYL